CPKSLMAPGVRLRLAFALQDNHQAGAALVEMKRLLASPAKSDAKPEPKSAEKDDPAAEEETEPETKPEATEDPVNLEYEYERYTSGETYPENEEDWDPKRSSVYPNITGADLDQIQQAIDTLLNFAP